MKKLKCILFVLFSTILCVGCAKTIYVDKDTNKVIEFKEHKGTDFFNLQRVDDDLMRPYIFVDTYTDVLYTEYFINELTVIMKADGSCLTYTEWKEKHNEYDRK